MKRRAMIVGVAALVIGGGAVTWRAVSHLRDARGFGAAHAVQTFGGTNYVARVVETTVGRTAAGPVVVVTVRLENPNPFAMVLERRWFVLVDGDKDYHLPATSAAQPARIELAPRGVADNELLTYSVSDDAFQGVLGLQIGHYYWTLVKGPRPYPPPLKQDEYRTFRRRDW